MTNLVTLCPFAFRRKRKKSKSQCESKTNFFLFFKTQVLLSIFTSQSNQNHNIICIWKNFSLHGSGVIDGDIGVFCGYTSPGRAIPPNGLSQLWQKQHDFSSVFSILLHWKADMGFYSIYKP